MRVHVMEGVGVGAVRERPRPVAGPGEVLVRVGAVGVCGSDVHWFQEGGIGDLRVTPPLVLGHEPSGTVEAVGEGVAPDLLGARVSIEPQVPCRRCRECHRGRYNLCPDIRFMATPPVDGAFAEYVAVPADFVHVVPDDVSDETAALLEPLSVGVWANRKAGVTAGSRVLITGAGPIGLIAAQVALALGAGEVVVTDLVPARLALAERFGTTTVPAGSDLGGDYDAFLECSGAGAAVTAGLNATGRGGAAVLVGIGAREVTLPVAYLQWREITLTGTFRYADTWPAALALVRRRVVDLDSLVTHHYKLEEAGQALDPTVPGVVKAVVHP